MKKLFHLILSALLIVSVSAYGAGLKLTNNASSTLASGITDIATSLTLAAGDGNLKFPSLSAGEYFYAYLVKSTGVYEIVKVTARSSDVLTMTRAQQGTSAVAFSTSDVVSARLTATDINDFPTNEDLQNAGMVWADAGGSADAITGAYTPAVTDVTNGMLLGVRAGSANATTTPTFSPDGLTARTIKRDNGDALQAGDIDGDGHDLLLRYDSSGPHWLLLNPTKPPASVLAPYLPLAGGTMTGDITFTAASTINAEGANITAAATTEIWTTDGDTAHIAGSTGISSFGTAAQAGMRKFLIFDGAPLLTHGSNLNLPGSVDYQVVAGDMVEVYADTTTQHDVRVFKQSLSGGKAVVYANGTKSSGTFTPNPTLGEIQTYTNGGAHTLAPPSVAGSILMTITNDGSAGTITTSSFTLVTGDAFTTTNANKFLVGIYFDGTNSVLKVRALQ